jgi:hypothetical protein
MSVTAALLWFALFVAAIVGTRALGFRPRSRDELFPSAALLVGGIFAAGMAVELWEDDHGVLAFLVAAAFVGLLVFLWPRLTRQR